MRGLGRNATHACSPAAHTPSKILTWWPDLGSVLSSNFFFLSSYFCDLERNEVHQGESFHPIPPPCIVQSRRQRPALGAGGLWKLGAAVLVQCPWQGC